MKDEKELISFLKRLGIEIHTSTKARGHHGFYIKNRIDISTKTPQNMRIPTIIHEFAHHIHSKIESDMAKSGGTIEKIFDDNLKDFYENELITVTNFVDENSKCSKLFNKKEEIKLKIKELDSAIRSEFPNFMRSKKFKEFEKFIKNSDAKYLLKYDRVKIIRKNILNKETVLLNIDNIENDFPEIPKAFINYIRLKSYMRHQKRISSRINKLQKYYYKPCELFARFVQGLNMNVEKIKELAPNSYKRFCELINFGYYFELSELKDLLNI